MKQILMCRPTHFRVEYQINPWMEIGSTNQTKAMTEWQQLVNIYTALEITVEFIEQDVRYPDMVFSADQGIVFDKNKLLLSNFRYPERQGETKFYERWFADHGYHIVHVPNDVYFEGGGETQQWGDALLLGAGFRSSLNAPEHITPIVKREVIPLDLVDERFYHLDTCLFVLNEEVIFYYPPAFSERSQQLLKQRVPQLLEFTIDDVLGFAANSVVVNESVIIQEDNQHFAKQIEQLGYATYPIDVSQFIKAGGGAHCLTNILA